MTGESIYVNYIYIYIYIYIYTVHVCDRTCRNQPYGAICNFSLWAILSLGGCFAVLFFSYQNDGVPLWNICTKFHHRRSFLSAVKY